MRTKAHSCDGTIGVVGECRCCPLFRCSVVYSRYGLWNASAGVSTRKKVVKWRAYMAKHHVPKIYIYSMNEESDLYWISKIKQTQTDERHR
jgi:hypothetical protein